VEPRGVPLLPVLGATGLQLAHVALACVRVMANHLSKGGPGGVAAGTLMDAMMPVLLDPLCV
jgi:hypothetical protein